jgi:hypothetical protein
MQKTAREQGREREPKGGRVLARVLAEDLRHVEGCGGGGSRFTTATNTDAALSFDTTFRGHDGD